MAKLKMNIIKFLQRPTNFTEISRTYTKFFVHNLATGALYNDVVLEFHVTQAGVTTIPI
jgi:hypothetical protein